jgi:endonuclease-3
MIAVRLSAQCTDERVNKVTPALFKAFPTLPSFAEARVEDVETLVHSCGFYKHKARDIVLACQMLISDYDSKVPDSMEELLKLPGVGRKTANLLLGDLYAQPGSVVCDTHCIRICGRLGLSQGKDPEKVERQLRAILPPEESSDFCHRIVLFGRDICTARNPQCGKCPLRPWCKEFYSEEKE